MNILLSYTRQWNCGDEFIAIGVKNILKNLKPFKNANFFIYNRAPDLHFLRHEKFPYKGENLNLSSIADNILLPINNSWSSNHDISFFDYVIFAGTPEWQGFMVSPITNSLLNSKKKPKIFYLGIGMFEHLKDKSFNDLFDIDKKILNLAELITVRDSDTQKLLEPVNAQLFPCPAIFSSENHKKRTKLSKIAFSSQSFTGYQPIDKTTYNYCRELLERLSKNHDISIIGHYVDDVYAWKDLGLPIIYSYDSNDYFDIYNNFDLTITTRVHGAGICASLGIPGIAIHHSARSGTVEGFKSYLIKPDKENLDNLIQKISSINIKKYSEEIINFKLKVKKGFKIN